MAVLKSASVLISQNQIDESQAKVDQARSGYYPALSLQARLNEQQKTENFAANEMNLNPQSSLSLNLNQNIFQGFRDLKLINQNNYLKTGFEFSKKSALQELYKEVAQAYFNLLIYQSDILLYQEQIESVGKRKTELRAAKKSGRARDSDILIIDSVVAQLQATVLKIQSQMISSSETFYFLTGLDRDVFLVNNFALPIKLDDSQTWLLSLEKRYDVEQAKYSVLAAEAAVGVAKSGYYPNLNLSANYYLSRSSEIYKDVDWDASLVLIIPLFSGGFNKSRVSEAQLIHQSEKNKLRLNEEQALQNIKSMVATVDSDLKQLEQIQKASDLNYQSYELVRRDNRLGVATNSDVLNSLQVWQESKRNLERLRLTANYDYIRLLLETLKMNAVAE